ncbi:hypothetical protein F0L17_12990 [Streptomyces sp. TRM43335]|uniref:Uncharacterized protein n=1 Tax=Streptomyces taklimakanensis TaxID=2569853 RepID=A0A6G2BD10_9ACTN|nr:hypothetical protein [Streptomyces taklimakanensis]MTE20016.1 hypothetical protein [Streptomyces taklimakanensis]
MAQAVHRGRKRNGITAVLNSDGRAHPLVNGLVAATAVLALIAVVTAFFPGLSLITSWAGLLGVVAGGWGQMISATTEERFVLVVGMGAAALGLFFGMWNGGLFGT